MIVFLHAGTHKTGTTAIQAFLWRHRELLAESGLYIPEAGTVGVAPEVAHHNIAWELAGHVTAPESGGLETLLAELRERKPERACVSSEVFSTLFDKPLALVRLRRALESVGAEIRPVLFFRPQAGYLEALYAEHVKHGQTDPFDVYLERVLADGSVEYNEATYGFEYDRMAGAFAQAFGAENVTIAAYTNALRAEEIIERFLAIVAPQTVDLDLTQLGAWERINLSIGFQGVAERLIENRESDAPVEEVLSELLPYEASSPDGPFRPLGIGDLARLLARFGPNNRALRRDYGLDLPVWFAKRLTDQVRARRLA
jgi:hypothetical protein